jgi:outer membrane protein TolC
MRAAAVALGALTLLAVAPARSATAQQGDTLGLTLERALEIARQSNPTYSQAVNDLELNAPESRAAWANEILPRVQLNLLTSYSGNLQRRGTDYYGNPVANPENDWSYFSSTRQGVSVYWQLQGPALLSRKRRLDATNDGRTLAAQVGVEALRIDLERRFYDALEQDELLTAERDVAEASRADQEAAQRLFELAVKTRVDVLQSELQAQQQALAVQQQAGRRAQARLALRALLGDARLPPVRPEPTDPPMFDPATLDDEALVRRAVEASGAVRMQEASLREAEAQVGQSHSVYWPTLNAAWQMGRYVQADHSSSLVSFGGFGGNALSSSFSLGVSLPFLSDPLGGRLGVTRAEVAREDRRDALRDARLTAEQTARTALVTLRDRYGTLQIAQRSVSIAGEAVELAREEYRLGGLSFEQLQLSVRSEADARRQLIEARYGFVQALLDLESAVGGMVR